MAFAIMLQISSLKDRFGEFYNSLYLNYSDSKFKAKI